MSDYKWYPDDYQMGIEPHKQQTALVVSEATQQPKKKMMKPWVVALVTALITSLLCTGVLGAFVFVPALNNLNSGSTVIYKDGNDLRNKIDLSTALGLQGESASGQEPLSIVEISRRVGRQLSGYRDRPVVGRHEYVRPPIADTEQRLRYYHQCGRLHRNEQPRKYRQRQS